MGNRVYYAIQQAKLRDTVIHGLQSVSTNLTHVMEPVQSCGQWAPYSIIRNSHEVNITLKKVLDGYSLLYHLASNDVKEIEGASFATCDCLLSVFDDSTNFCADLNSVAVSNIKYESLYISSIKYTFKTTGAFEEEISLVGDIAGIPQIHIYGEFDPDNADKPLSSIGVNYRPNIISTGLPMGGNVSSITMSANITRENIPQFASKFPFIRLPTVIETTTEITTIATGVGGTTPENGGCSTSGATSPVSIKIVICEDTGEDPPNISVDLGSNNHLVGMSQSGGDATGGNMMHTYTYKGYNHDFTVTHER